MMDPTKKYKALVSIIIFLLITNFILLILFMNNSSGKKDRNHDHDQNGISNILQKEVGFSQAQLNQYQMSRTELRKNIKPLFNRIRKSKENFYGLLYADNVSDSLVNLDADSIALAQKELDMQMLHHFKIIRNICTPGQVPKFDSSMKKVIGRMTGRTGKPDHK